MTKEDDEAFENSTKCWVCDNAYVDGDVKVRDHCHITGTYRGSARRDCNINVKLNHKIPILFCNLKNYDWNLIMQELDSFQFLSSFLDSLVKNLGKDNFKYLSQEFYIVRNKISQAKQILSLWVYEWFWKVKRKITKQRKVL